MTTYWHDYESLFIDVIRMWLGCENINRSFELYRVFIQLTLSWMIYAVIWAISKFEATSKVFCSGTAKQTLLRYKKRTLLRFKQIEPKPWFWIIKIVCRAWKKNFLVRLSAITGTGKGTQKYLLPVIITAPDFQKDILMRNLFLI